MRSVRDDIMGMPIMVEIVGGAEGSLNAVFEHFKAVDMRFSTYKKESEISQINRKERTEEEYSRNMKEVFALAKRTKEETGGFFSIERPDGTIDPSGIVKGWSILNAAQLVESLGYKHYFIDVAGDIQSRGEDPEGRPWTIGIRNPFEEKEIVKVIIPRGCGVATSGTSVRGQHIYDPHEPGSTIDDIASITVIGPNIYDADRFATAAFAMGEKGVAFIEQLPGFEAYQIDRQKRATMTSGFKQFTL